MPAAVRRGDFGFDAMMSMQPPTVERGNWCFEPGTRTIASPAGAPVVDARGRQSRELLSVSAPAGGRFAVGFADDGDDADFAFLKLFGHFSGRCCNRWRKSRAPIFSREREIAQDALGEAADIFEVHGLALAVGADDRIVKGERKFDDWIEAGERNRNADSSTLRRQQSAIRKAGRWFARPCSGAAWSVFRRPFPDHGGRNVAALRFLSRLQSNRRTSLTFHNPVVGATASARPCTSKMSAASPSASCAISRSREKIRRS